MRFPEPMDVLIQVRVSREEKRQLAEVARQHGKTLSEFVRETTTDAAGRVAA